MTTNRKLIVLCFLLLETICLFSQDYNISDLSLDEKVTQNAELAFTDPDKSYQNIEILLDEALKTGNHQAELKLLAQRCWYYNHTMDLEKSLEAIRDLQEKAIKYEDKYHQAIAHQNFSGTYALSGLPDKSISEFEKAMKILNRLDENDPMIISSKINAYQLVSNAWLLKEDYPKAVKMLRRVNEEIEKLTDNEKIRKRHFTNFSNLASVYIYFKPDSAEYYARKSMELKTPEVESSTPLFKNYLILGLTHHKGNNLPQALIYYKEAESLISQSKAALFDMQDLYQGMIGIYTQTDSIEQAEVYAKKLSAVELEIERNKNKSLHKIIDNQLMSDRSTVIYVAVSLSVIIIILLTVVSYFRRKNRLLVRQEQISRQYLKEIRQQPESNEKNYSKLIEMVKSNDPAFMPAFHETFPDFTDKIKAIYDKVGPTEVEFYAMLKLNLSTKEIARYRNVEPRSVQTRKYRTRKKLNIPDDEDIYLWFSKL